VNKNISIELLELDQRRNRLKPKPEKTNVFWSTIVMHNLDYTGFVKFVTN